MRGRIAYHSTNKNVSVFWVFFIGIFNVFDFRPISETFLWPVDDVLLDRTDRFSYQFQEAML
jgi:hypothetical protein